MSFKSKAQQRFMYAKHPKIAKEFASKTDFSEIPEKVTAKEALKRRKK